MHICLNEVVPVDAFPICMQLGFSPDGLYLFYTDLVRLEDELNKGLLNIFLPSLHSEK